MDYLYELIQQRVDTWRDDGYPTDDYPAIADILDYATLPETDTRRFLRKAQLRALETYWYLRLVEHTPHIFDLYQRYYPGMKMLDALGLATEEIKDWLMGKLMAGETTDVLWDRIRQDEDFVKDHKLESVHETLTLDYPSYILALAMGAGKTMLIGAIAATEFAMALEYHPDADGPFIQNALVFAPGLTIIESLRELADIDYSKILPSRLYRPFEATYKLIFTRKDEKDIPVIRGSRYNLVVTNTEKIRIQKRNYRHHTWSDLKTKHMVEQYEAEANLRLQAIASLPNLGLFSDEAHHTYGQEMGKRLKRVRQTVDYLHEKTNLVCVVNTTGTPYYKRQPLRDVVIWYGLSAGIRDGILKSVEDNIYAYDFEEQHTDQFVAEVVRDFFEDYGDVRLPNGAKAKLAMYFPQTKHLRAMRPVVEHTLMKMGYPINIVLRNTSNSPASELDDFNRLNHPHSPHRVILLVNKGTEGWNCPSLFACALARKLKRSKNFVLQASTRCLRQVPGNDRKARIYLSMDNRGTLDRQLQETYGETVEELNRTDYQTHTAHLAVQKREIPPLLIDKPVRMVVPADSETDRIQTLTMPEPEAETVLVRKIYTTQVQPTRQSVLQQVDDDSAVRALVGPDVYTAATALAAVYRLDIWSVYSQLKRLYGAGATVPETHMSGLAKQIEDQTRRYEIKEDAEHVELALIKIDGFDETQDDDGNTVYTAQFTYRKDKEHLLLSWRQMKDDNEGDFGFHYDPYKFDSSPEQDFFQQMLQAINTEPEQVEDIYFTGALTDPQKTDFYVQYKGADGEWHRYSPDFLLRRKDARCYIVEIKMEMLRDDEVDGEEGRKAIAIQEWVGLNPDKLQYKMIFTDSDAIAFNKLEPVKRFIEEE